MWKLSLMLLSSIAVVVLGLIFFMEITLILLAMTTTIMLILFKYAPLVKDKVEKKSQKVYKSKIA
jgi:predicted membrane protein